MLETIAVNMAEIKDEFDKGVVTGLLSVAESIKNAQQVRRKQLFEQPNNQSVAASLLEIEGMFMMVKRGIDDYLKSKGYKTVQINDAVEGVA